MVGFLWCVWNKRGGFQVNKVKHFSTCLWSFILFIGFQQNENSLFVILKNSRKIVFVGIAFRINSDKWVLNLKGLCEPENQPTTLQSRL